jgi:hypothetical protein
MSARRATPIATLSRPTATGPGDPLTTALGALAVLLRPLVAETVRDAVFDALSEHAAAEPSRPELLTTDELAAELRVCSKTVARLRADGMPVLHVGDSPRFRLGEVLAWLSSSSQQRQAGK